MSKIKLQNLIDVKTMQKIQDGFANVTGMAALIVDADGNPYTKLSNPSGFCMELTRKTELGFKRCNECDAMGGEKALKLGKAYTYSCHAGLTDFAAPIVVNGERIGSFVGGQVLTEKPNPDKIRKIAKELGIDEGEYVTEINKIKILSQKQIDDAADFLYTIASIISKMAYEGSTVKQGSAVLKDNANELNEKINDISELIKSNTDNNKKLYENFDMLDQAAKNSFKNLTDTKDTVKIIQDIAMNTRILGFNASIEASRAKESGKGFGVIAQEVRSLADTSQSSAEKIQDTIDAISSDTEEIAQNIKATENIVEKNIEYTNDIANLLKDITEITMKMK